MSGIGCYVRLGKTLFQGTKLTMGPWSPKSAHGGPPSALAAHVIGEEAAVLGFTQMQRLSVALVRPVPTEGQITVAVEPEYVGRGAAHYRGRILDASDGKLLYIVSALVTRSVAVPLPPTLAGHPLELPPPLSASRPAESLGMHFGYLDLIELRVSEGRVWDGPCTVWMRMRHPLVVGEPTLPMSRVAVFADASSGVSLVLKLTEYAFPNADLVVNLFRAPVGEWICLRPRSLVGDAGAALADTQIFDESGLVGRCTQNLVVSKM